MSGERGTKSQQQDRANQRDRDRSVANGGSGDRGTRSQQQDRRNMDNAKKAGNSAPGVSGRENRGNNPGNPSAPGYLDYDTQKTTMPNGQRVEVGKVRTDYIDAENRTIPEKIGGFIAGIFGMEERNPYADPDYGVDPTQPGRGANWDLDVVQVLANFAGLATGAPVGTAYKVGKWGYEQVTGKPVTGINLGPDVFGSGGQRPTPTDQGGTKISGDKPQTDKGGKRGLLSSYPQQQSAPAPKPQQPQNPQTPPSTPPNSKYPTPDQKFQAGSYYMGDWVFDPATQKPVWQQKPNGLMPSAA